MKKLVSELSAKEHLSYLIHEKQQQLFEYMKRETSSLIYAQKQQEFIGNLLKIQDKIEDKAEIPMLNQLFDKIYHAVQQPELGGVIIHLFWNHERKNFNYINEYNPELKMYVR